jgi:hypothetical protein
LGPLIEKYNGQLTSNEPYSIDQQVVTIRNALAHGLVIAPSNMSLALAPVMSLPLTLFHDGQSYVMTVDWFQDQQTLAQAQINRILACATKRGISSRSLLRVRCQAVLNGEVALVQSGLAKLVVSFHCLPMRSRNSRSLASSHRLGSVRLMFELPSCAYLAILRAPSLPNCDS